MKLSGSDSCVDSSAGEPQTLSVTGRSLTLRRCLGLLGLFSLALSSSKLLCGPSRSSWLGRERRYPWSLSRERNWFFDRAWQKKKIVQAALSSTNAATLYALLLDHHQQFVHAPKSLSEVISSKLEEHLCVDRAWGAGLFYCFITKSPFLEKYFFFQRRMNSRMSFIKAYWQKLKFCESTNSKKIISFR